ncbi:MAG: hypothetical protein U0L76_00975 [Ruminococcus sp.]|nr:hypothetical protein [Ruminococcus sp.]
MVECKCKHCQKEWFVKESFDEVKYCTFCGKIVEKPIEKPDRFDSITEILVYLIQLEGKEVFCNHNKILGFVSDYLPNCKLEKNILRQLLSSYAYQYVIESDYQSLDTNKEKAIKRLVDEYGMSINWAEQSIGWIVDSVYLKNTAKKPKQKEVESLNQKTEDNRKITSQEDDNNRQELTLGYIRNSIIQQNTIAVSKYFAAILDEGMVSLIPYNCPVSVDDWKEINFIKLASGDNHLVALTSDGYVESVGKNDKGQCDLRPYGKWKELIDIATGFNFTVGLKNDSSLIATGEGLFFSQLERWKNVCRINAGGYHILGLTNEGTVYSAGRNSFGQCSVGDWKDIIDISAGQSHSLGLKKDGTVVATGANIENNPKYSGRCEVAKWTNIVAISAGENHSLGLRADGSVVATGDNKYGQCDVDTLSDIICIKAGFGYSACLDRSKKLYIIGKQFSENTARTKVYVF